MIFDKEITKEEYDALFEKWIKGRIDNKEQSYGKRQRRDNSHNSTDLSESV